jgi:hypothetical protein
MQPKLFSLFLVLIGMYFGVPAHAQCGLSLTNSAGGSVPGGTLTVASANSTIQRVRWYKDGVLVQTENATWNPNGTVIMSGGTSPAATDLFLPQVAGFGDTLYIGDYNNRLFRWWRGLATPERILGTAAGTAGPAPGGTHNGNPFGPAGVYVDAENRIYIWEWAGKRVSRFNFTAPQLVLRGYNNNFEAGGCALNDTAYSCEYYQNRVMMFPPGNTSGIVILTGATAVRAVRVYADSFYVVAANKVQRYARGSTVGTLLAGTGVAGPGLDQLNDPQGLFIDHLKNIYLGDYGNNRVVRFAPGSTQAEIVAGTGGTGTGLNVTPGPAGLWISPKGYMYVAEHANNRVLEFTPTINSILSGTTTPGVYKAVVDGFDGCRDSVLLTIAPPLPPQPGVFTAAPAAVCQGTSGVTYTFPAVGGATSYVWTYSGSGVTFSGTSSTTTPSNNLNFSASATGGTLSVQAVNGAGPGPNRDTVITVNGVPAQPGAFSTGPASVCQGQTSVSYTVPTVAGATSYEWAYSGSNTTFPGGSSTLSATNTINFNAGATNGNISVSAKNTCGTSTARTLAVTVGSTPAQPGAFSTGPASVCQGQTSVSYTVPAVAGATSYEWAYSGSNTTFPGGSSTSSPSNTINFSASATGGNISVSAKNTCGTSAARSLAVTVGSAPAQPGAFTASASSVCPDQTGVVYTVPAVGTATSYEWSYSGSGVSFSGTTSTTTPSNMADFSGSATAGDISVVAKNSCGTSTARSVAVTVATPPVATMTPTVPVDICADDSVRLTAGTGTGYSYQWKRDGVGVGTGDSVYVAYASGNYKVVVTGPASCKDSTQEVAVTVYSRPVATLVPGDTAFCEGGVVTLEVSSQDTGLTYRWKNGSTVVPLASAYFLEIEETGVYRVIVGRNHVGQCEDSTNTVTITVYPLPVVDITWDFELLHATPGHNTYQWQTGGQPIAGATDSTFRPSSDGGYSVTVTDANGCSSTSSTYNVTVGVADVAAIAAQIKVYPNPSGGRVYVESPVALSLSLYSMDGRVLQSNITAGYVDVTDYANGVYLLRITGPDGVLIRTDRIIRQHR